MAKRRKVKEEEEFEFKIPEFDEKTFTKKEKRNVKVTFVAFTFGLIIGMVSQFLWTGMTPSIRWPLILLFSLSVIPILRYTITKLNIDTSDYGKKEWVANYSVYFFTWLTVLIVLINPPFYDEEAPTADMAILPQIQEPGEPLLIAAYVVDNVGISSINLSISKPDGEIVYPSYTINGSTLSSVYKGDINGTFLVTLKVRDQSGNMAVVNRTFNYSPDVIRLVYPSNGSTVDHNTPIRFEIDKNISEGNPIVYYIVNGEKINLTEADGIYETSPLYEGWKPNSITNITVVVNDIHYFNYFHSYGFNNTVKVNFTFLTKEDPNIGTEPSPESNIKPLQPQPKTFTPGFEMLSAILSLILAVFIFTKRRKN